LAPRTTARSRAPERSSGRRPCRPTQHLDSGA
jgi:hypothetical protein